MITLTVVLMVKVTVDEIIDVIVVADPLGAGRSASSIWPTPTRQLRVEDPSAAG